MSAQLLYKYSNVVMILAVFLGAIGAIAAYGFELSLPAQVTAHILTIVAPAFLKLGYVGRMTACQIDGRAIDC